MSSSARDVFTVTSLVEISFNKFIGYLQNIFNKREESHSFYVIADYWAKRNAAGKASIKQFYTSRMTHAFEHGTVPMDQFGNFDRNIVTKVMVEAMNDHRDRRSPPLTPPMPVRNLDGYRGNEAGNGSSDSTGGIIMGYMDM